MQEYFAVKEPLELASEVVKLTEIYYEYIRAEGRLILWRNSYGAYHRGITNRGRIQREGEQEEYLSMSVGSAHYRNLLQHLLVMATSNRPALDPIAVNSDTKSIAQCILSQGLLDYYLRDKGHALEKRLKQACELALVFGEGYLTSTWSVTGGDEYGVDENNRPVRTGDIKFGLYNPIDVIRDVYKTSALDHDWYVIRDYENKFTLAAKYPELAEKILSINPDWIDKTKLTRFHNLRSDNTSTDIPVLTFYHRRTDALPNGRVLQCLDSNTVLIDSPMPYKKLPVYRIAPGDQIGTIWGHTVGFDLLEICEAIDIMYSTIVTNSSTFGVGNVMAPRGSNINHTQLSGGLNFIEYDGQAGKPEPLNLTATPPEVFNFMVGLEKLSETISGVNSVARGNPEASLKSGAALALVSAQSINFANGLVNSYTELLEDVGTSVINLLTEFASVPRIAFIAGKNNRNYMKEFTGADLENVDRVVVQSGNPLSKTLSGKVEMATQLMQNGMIENPDQYIQVLTTGQFTPLIQSKQAQLMLIRSENEKLMEGQQIQAILTDRHQEHILEHQVVLASPESRTDNSVVQATLAHITEHITLLSDPANATLFGLLGQQPVQQTPSAPAPANEGQPSQVLNAQNPITQQAEKVNMPNMPTNPLTGQKAV